MFKMFNVDAPHLIYALLGGFVVIFGMFSLFLREKLYIGEACWAFLFGVVIGPYAANVFSPRDWGGGGEDTTNTIVLEFTRVVLAIGVFAIGVELPKAYMARHWKSLFFLLCPVMTWGWFVSAGLIYALIPGLNFLSSLAIAACLTPTDPILAAAVVGGKYADKHVPAHLRHLLAAESACNDGAAYPFLFIALYLVNDKTVGDAIKDWVLLLWLYQIILGCVFGALLGFGFRHLMKFCERKDLIDRQSYVAQYVSLAILTIGCNTLLGSDDLLASFACGTAFAWDGFFNKQTEQSVFSSVIDLLFNIAAFIFLGAWMPFGDFEDAALTLTVWRLVVIAILVILLRRLPILIALYRWIPDVKTFREAVFSGHFGPMGIGAVFISTLAAGQLPKPSDPPANQKELLAASIQPIVAFMVLCSIAVHGLSIPFFSLGRRVHSVTRTWSRHDTFGTFTGRGAPEWTQQTRQVVPGQDIVINRDDEMERGALPPHVMAGREEGDVTQEEKEGSSQDDSATRVDGSDIRDENYPDGTEVLQEWKEGHHRIVERRAGPGDEVDVEVQENYYGPELTTIDTIRVAEGAAQQTARSIRERMRNAPQDLGNFIHRVEDGVRDSAHEVQCTMSDVERRAKHVAAEFTEPQDDEEGWMSDTSNGGNHASSEGEGARSSPKKSSKASSSRPPGRRRMSVRRHFLGPRGRSQSDESAGAVLQRHESYPQPTRRDDQDYGTGTESPDESRGRRPTTTSSELALPSHMRQVRPRHARIDSLRSLGALQARPSRDQSPARSLRSVRWADEYSGANTPRLLSPSSPATPLPGTPIPGSEPASEGEDEPRDSPRNQVRFSLPEIPERR